MEFSFTDYTGHYLLQCVSSLQYEVFLYLSLNLRGYPWFMSGSKHAHLNPAGLQASLPCLLVYLSIKFVFISSKVVCPCCGSDTELPTFNPILH